MSDFMVEEPKRKTVTDMSFESANLNEDGSVSIQSSGREVCTCKHEGGCFCSESYEQEEWCYCDYCKRQRMIRNIEIFFYFRKEAYGWMSNFERSPQEVGGFVFPTNEHFYQSYKAVPNEYIRLWIIQAPTPHCAMIAGRGLREHEILDDWDNLKVDVMLQGLRAKFTQNASLKTKLLETGDAILHEDSPTDMFWGIKGEDMLGKLLMKVRTELREMV